jgi:hypothetical protein
MGRWLFHAAVALVTYSCHWITGSNYSLIDQWGKMLYGDARTS